MPGKLYLAENKNGCTAHEPCDGERGKPRGAGCLAWRGFGQPANDGEPQGHSTLLPIQPADTSQRDQRIPSIVRLRRRQVPASCSGRRYEVLRRQIERGTEDAPRHEQDQSDHGTGRADDCLATQRNRAA